MKDPIIIERADLEAIIMQIVPLIASRAINDTINELGLKRTPLKPWVSENHAVRVMKIGRDRLKAAASNGTVRSKVIQDKQTHCKFFFKADIQKLLNNPTL